jgi:hypothetical protein
MSESEHWLGRERLREMSERTWPWWECDFRERGLRRGGADEEFGPG